MNEFTKDELRLIWIGLHDRANFEDRQARSRQLTGPRFADARKMHRDERDRYLALAGRVSAMMRVAVGQEQRQLLASV